MVRYFFIPPQHEAVLAQAVEDFRKRGGYVCLTGVYERVGTPAPTRYTQVKDQVGDFILRDYQAGEGSFCTLKYFCLEGDLLKYNYEQAVLALSGVVVIELAQEALEFIKNATE